MKSTDLKFNPIDGYLDLLKNLSLESKMELIKKLSDSLKGSKKTNGESPKSLYGAFVSKKSADEIIANLKSSRDFNRSIERL
jgi:predicted metal-binding transcription factor (methanogenesis marker protein 9)